MSQVWTTTRFNKFKLRFNKFKPVLEKNCWNCYDFVKNYLYGLLCELWNTNISGTKLLEAPSRTHTHARVHATFISSCKFVHYLFLLHDYTEKSSVSLGLCNKHCVIIFTSYFSTCLLLLYFKRPCSPTVLYKTGLWSGRSTGRKVSLSCRNCSVGLIYSLLMLAVYYYYYVRLQQFLCTDFSSWKFFCYYIILI